MCLTTIKDGGTLEREASVTLSRTDDAVQIKDKVKQAKGKLQQTMKSYTAKGVCVNTVLCGLAVKKSDSGRFRVKRQQFLNWKNGYIFNIP